MIKIEQGKCLRLAICGLCYSEAIPLYLSSIALRNKSYIGVLFFFIQVKFSMRFQLESFKSDVMQVRSQDRHSGLAKT